MIDEFISLAQSCTTLCDPMDCSMPGLPIHHQLLELAQIHVHWVSNAILPSHPLSSPSPPAFTLSKHQSLFQWVRSSHQVAKYWSFTFSISPSSEYSGLISLRMGWLNLLAVQGTLRVFSSINLVAYKIASYYLIDLSGQKSVMAQLGLPFRVPHSSINGCVLSLFKGWLSSGLFHP